jgi:hypothetical protein
VGAAILDSTSGPLFAHVLPKILAAAGRLVALPQFSWPWTLVLNLSGTGRFPNLVFREVTALHCLRTMLVRLHSLLKGILSPVSSSPPAITPVRLGDNSALDAFLNDLPLHFRGARCGWFPLSIVSRI